MKGEENWGVIHCFLYSFSFFFLFFLVLCEHSGFSTNFNLEPLDSKPVRWQPS